MVAPWKQVFFDVFKVCMNPNFNTSIPPFKLFTHPGVPLSTDDFNKLIDFKAVIF